MKKNNPGFFCSISRHNVATLRHILGITSSVRRPLTKELCFREKKVRFRELGAGWGAQNDLPAVLSGCLVPHPDQWLWSPMSGGKESVNHVPWTDLSLSLSRFFPSLFGRETRSLHREARCGRWSLIASPRKSRVRN